MRDVLIVGSVPLVDSEAVFRALAGALGDRIRRLPDGETGERINWIEFQTPVFDRHPMFEPAPEDEGAKADWRNAAADTVWKIKSWHRLRRGVSGSDVAFGSLGYAQAAKRSYEVFARLKQAGVILQPCRFQVSLPTPYNVIDQRIAPKDRLAVERAYEARMLEEIDEIAAAIPHGALAIQWDTAHEIQNLDGGRPHWFDDAEAGIVERLARLGDSVPAGVELGYHLCYGDFNHRHFIEPKDSATLVRVANALSRQVDRAIDYIHMPVPLTRTDDAYFAPLRELALKPGCALYLGLVHFTDGVGGTLARVAAAQRVLSDFGIATECGFGRRPPETVPELLRIHAEVADRMAGATIAPTT
jgi:methionine synthase II (cobalamin-independent)